MPLHPLEDVVVRGAITETVSPGPVAPKFVIYILPLFALKGIAIGRIPTGIVAITVSVELSITETCY